MTQQAQEALKPCPFCGAEVVLKPSHYGDYSSVICMGNDPCEGKMSIVIPNDGLSSGIAAWNRRAPAQLEAQQAAVQLPESVYTLRVRGRLHDHTPGQPAFDLPDGST